ncbi:lipid phosphate phosphatase 1 [Coprinopsis sp. MPI-PUGE-AT-0042]|nr:lipid phosphate phosphatase 1 [Coprinopsis sp. MPI-PUGE-AT-0042]
MALDFQARVRRILRKDFPSILGYTGDVVVFIALSILAYYAAVIPVTQRVFFMDDESIQYPHREEQIPDTLNDAVATFLPSAVIIAIALLNWSPMHFVHGMLALVSTRLLNSLVTNFLKNRVGRLRPDFLARCQWDVILEACTGKENAVLEGRRSFPSGHSSSAFSGMFFLSLVLAGQSAAWCFNARSRPWWASSRWARLFISLAPLGWAFHVALTRVEDYRHHKEDVVAGGLIGALSAFACYTVYWPNPFSAKTFSLDNYGAPRLYRKANDGFVQLTPTDEDSEA